MKILERIIEDSEYVFDAIYDAAVYGFYYNYARFKDKKCDGCWVRKDGYCRYLEV